jgi:hypothetical protein
MNEQYLIVIHCLIIRITYDVWPQAGGCNRFVLETRYTVLPSSIDSYGVLCQRKERVSPSVAQLTTCDVTKRLLDMKKKSLERVVQRKVLCENRGYHEGDCEYCCPLGYGDVWCNRRVLTFRKNLLHPGDEGSQFLWRGNEYDPEYTASLPWRKYFFYNGLQSVRIKGKLGEPKDFDVVPVVASVRG